MKQILGINYYFGEQDRNDAIFRPERRDAYVAGFVQDFKKWIESHYEVEIHTWDCVDYRAPEVRAVLYFDYSWRYASRDTFLQRIPFEKRALYMIEPENVNPSLYYVPWYRNRFSKIFTWDVRLLYRHPDYIPINVLVGAEPTQYRENRFSKLSFPDKKPLVAVSRNLWSYMPQSNYGVRRRAYSYFDRHWPESFDLFGTGWNEPVGPFDRYLGYPRYRCYRGPIVGSWNEKVAQLAKYRFALCFENNASQPGYISEKITDCLCARCVPIYYGSNGTEHRIPETCWIDARRFRSYAELDSFLRTITDRDYDEYIKSIDRFMGSTDLDFFSADFTFDTLAKGLGLGRGATSQIAK